MIQFSSDSLLLVGDQVEGKISGSLYFVIFSAKWLWRMVSPALSYRKVKMPTDWFI